jgi:hypothetical protein
MTSEKTDIDKTIIELGNALLYSRELDTLNQELEAIKGLAEDFANVSHNSRERLYMTLSASQHSRPAHFEELTPEEVLIFLEAMFKIYNRRCDLLKHKYSESLRHP